MGVGGGGQSDLFPTTVICYQLVEDFYAMGNIDL